MVKMVIKADENGGNRVQVMTMDSLAQFGASIRFLIPDLFDPEIKWFDSGKGLMIRGIEGIGDLRYYQGWWMQGIEPR